MQNPPDKTPAVSEPYLPPHVLEGLERQRLKRKRRWLLFVLLVVLPSLLIAACLTGNFFHQREKAARQLEEAIAETDKLDPGWRLEDIERELAKLPAEENAAIPLMRAASMLPQNWYSMGNPIDRKFYTLFEELPNWGIDPNLEIDKEVIEKLRKAVEAFPNALTNAREAVPLKTGYYAVQRQPGGMPVPHVDSMGKLISFSLSAAAVASSDHKNDEAWQIVMIIQAAARSTGEQPTYMPLLRQHWHTNAIRAMEQCMAQGKVSEPLLAGTQQAICAEASLPFFYHAMRGERAERDLFFRNLEAGKVDLISYARNGNRIEDPTLWETATFLLNGHTHKAQHAWVLRHMNSVVDASKLPPKELLKRFKELGQMRGQATTLVRNYVPDYFTQADSYVRHLALLACTNAALGVERFRLKTGRWPDSLEEVVAAKFLDGVPLDPFDEKPIRYRKTTDGVVIYSSGLEGYYAGDALDQGNTFNPDFIRPEFRLWDESHRANRLRFAPKIDNDKKGPLRAGNG